MFTMLIYCTTRNYIHHLVKSTKGNGTLFQFAALFGPYISRTIFLKTDEGSIQHKAAGFSLAHVEFNVNMLTQQ